MKEISITEYEQLGGIHHRFDPSPTTEKAWYVHSKDLLGIVLLDNIDSDWSFVALARDPRQPPGKEFRAFDLGVSFTTFELAKVALEQALKNGPEESFFTEKVI